MFAIAALAIVSRFFLLAIVYTLRLFAAQANLGVMQFLFELSYRWDGNSYLFIAQNWYVSYGDEAGFIVFPPLYPIMTRTMSKLLGSFNFSALLVSNFFFVLSCLALYKLSRLDFNKKISFTIVTLYALFPTSYFFSVGYPESLYAFLVLSAFYFIRQHKYALSAIYAGFATLTRPFSLAIWPALFIEWLSNKKRKINELLILIVIGAASAGIYLLINYQTFGDYFAFRTMLSQYWHKNFGFFVNGIIKSWKIGLGRQENDYYKYLVGYGEALGATAAWLIIVYTLIKHKTIRASYIVYSLIAIFMATSTAFILSVPRYYLSIPFLFIFVGSKLHNKWILFSLYFIFLIGNIILLFRFSRGQWAF
jgi:Gpi18-like mannosyltransferase